MEAFATGTIPLRFRRMMMDETTSIVKRFIHFRFYHQ
jgi:hypothetical protein